MRQYRTGRQAVRRRQCRIGVTGLVAALLLVLVTGSISAPVSAAQISVTGRPVPGKPLTVTGSGFTVAVTTCQITLDGRSIGGRCGIDRYVSGSLPLSAVTGLSAGVHTVQVCAPSCADAWAGRTSASLEVQDVSSPEPAVPSKPPAIPQPRASPSVGPPIGARDPAAPAKAGVVPAAYAIDSPKLSPNPARPDSDVTVEAPGLPTLPVPMSACSLRWDDAAVPGTACTVADTGVLTGSVVVPATAAPGAHTVTACRPDCRKAFGGRADYGVAVAAPGGPGQPPRSPTRVTVPPLLGLTRTEAESTLGKARLTPGTITGAGRVERQDPTAGSQVPAGSVVSLRLSPVAPGPVRLPSLIGMSLTAATVTVAPLGLTVSASGSGERVASQLPPAGTLVRPGTRVLVTLESAASGTAVSRVAPVLAAGVLVLVGGLLGRAVHGRLGKGSLPQLRIQPDCSPTIAVQALPAGPPGPSVRLRVIPDPAPGRRTEVRS